MVWSGGHYFLVWSGGTLFSFWPNLVKPSGSIIRSIEISIR